MGAARAFAADAPMPTPAEPLLSTEQAAALLGISRATFYRLPFFRQRKVKISPRRIGFEPSDVQEYRKLQRVGRQ